MDAYEIFEDWLVKNGAEFSRLELRSYDDSLNSTVSACTSIDDSSQSTTNDSSSEEKKECKSSSSEERNHGNHGNNRHNNHPDPDSNLDKDSEMRGVHAKIEIPADTICVAIPRKCLITVEMGQATQIGQVILRSDLDLDAPKHIFLMIFLLYDRKVNGESSFFKPYYDILPKTLSNIPIFWKESELDYLRGSYLLHQINDRVDAITEDYYAICNVAPQLAHIATLEEFKWARMCVCSRNFGLQIDGHRTSALVPHADMLNHHRPRETKWSFDDDLQSFTITTLQSISAGAQVYDSYGQKCNHRFLLNYGFAVEDNSELDGFCPNEVPIELTVDMTKWSTRNENGGENSNNSNDDENSIDPLFEARYEFWTRGDCDGSGSTTSSGLGPSTHAFSVAMGAALGAVVDSNANVHVNTQHTLRSQLSLSSTTAKAALDAVAGIISGEAGDNGSASTALKDNGNGNVAEIALTNTNAHASSTTQENVSTHVKSRTITATAVATPNPSNPRPHSSSVGSDDSSALALKRVRVCISSNENTRVLFSMLRVLAANGEDLRAMSTAPTLPFGDSGCSVYLSRALRGYTAANPDSAAFVTMQHAAFFRTCRDIRNPINLRNERGAMQYLMKVVASQLEAYTCSLAQDIVDLRDEEVYPMFSNRRHAKIQVRGEKEVLHHFGQWAQTALHIFDVIDNELIMERQTDSGQTGSSLNSHASFDSVIHAMDDDDAIHFTILRYCSDVLGALRKDAIQSIRNKTSRS